MKESVINAGSFPFLSSETLPSISVLVGGHPGSLPAVEDATPFHLAFSGIGVISSDFDTSGNLECVKSGEYSGGNPLVIYLTLSLLP